MVAEEKKERVIHTRISEQLERELKEKAARLGVSVSNLVRNVLLNTLDLVEEVVTDSVRVAGSVVSGVAGRPAAPLGWQEVVLNLNAVCSACNAIVPKGGRGGVGVGGPAGAHAQVLCEDCLEGLAGPVERAAADDREGGQRRAD